jgi:alpha-tubulin suppressor-like RCC1 family protein
MFIQCMYGQLGRGSGSCSPSLAAISELHGVTSVSAGEFHAVATNAQGALYAWGYNKDGQLGNGSTSNRCASVFYLIEVFQMI